MQHEPAEIARYRTGVSSPSFPPFSTGSISPYAFPSTPAKRADGRGERETGHYPYTDGKRKRIIRASVTNEPMYDAAVKGDRVEIVIDAGAGLQRYEIAATKAGRRVEVSTSRGQIEVSEVTRTGQPVRTARFLAGRVVALVEHPAEAEEHPRRRAAPKDQASLI